MHGIQALILVSSPQRRLNELGQARSTVADATPEVVRHLMQALKYLPTFTTSLRDGKSEGCQDLRSTESLKASSIYLHSL
jgi:hypothetical protein